MINKSTHLNKSLPLCLKTYNTLPYKQCNTKHYNAKHVLGFTEQCHSIRKVSVAQHIRHWTLAPLVVSGGGEGLCGFKPSH